MMKTSHEELLLGTARTLRALLIMFQERESFAPFHQGLIDLQWGLDECLKPFQPSPVMKKMLMEKSGKHRCSTCLRDFSSEGSCIVHIGNYHSKGGIGEYDPKSHAIQKGDLHDN